jgi:hypothetical protein
VVIARERNGFLFSEIRVVTMATIRWIFLKVIDALSACGGAA